MGFDAFAQFPAGYAFYFLLSGGIDRQYQQNIGLIKRAGEIIKQCLGPGVAMRLKHDNFAVVRPALFDGLESGFNFSRMMPVIIYHGNAIYLSFDFQSALNPLKGLKGTFDGIDGDIQIRESRLNRPFDDLYIVHTSRVVQQVSHGSGGQLDADDQPGLLGQVRGEEAHTAVGVQHRLVPSQVEIVVKKGGRCRYTTIQNWSNNVYNLVTKRAAAYENATMEWVTATSARSSR